jgi:hypothetical protein
MKWKRLRERDRSNDPEHRLDAMEKCTLARTTLHGTRN